MDMIIAKIDPVIDRMEKSLEKIELFQNRRAKLPGAELDLLKQLEDARDLMQDCMKKTASDRGQLEAVFGGNCVRILRIRAAVMILDERPLSDMNRNDQRLKGAHDACDSVIKVLEDMGYGWLLRSRLFYGDESGEPFKGHAFTVGTPIKEIRPQCADGAFTKFSIDKDLIDGLSFDAGTGAISGIPKVQCPPTDYVISCEGSGKPVDCKLSFTVLPKPILPPGKDGFMYDPPQNSFRIGKEIAKWLPKLAGGDPPTEFIILPSLPPGLTLDKLTGIISGVPGTLVELGPYTVTVKNMGGVTHCKIALEVNPDHQGDIVARIIACTEAEELTEFEAEVVEEKNAKKPFNWMIWMVHRAHLNDPTLKKFDFTNLKMPSGLEEPLIAPKLVVALASNDQIEELLLASTMLQNHEAAVMAVSLRSNTKMKVLNIDSNALRPLELESLAHGIGDNQTLEQFRCNSVCAPGRQVNEAILEMVKKNIFLTKVGIEIKEAHFRNQIDSQITRNTDAARKRRVEAKKAAEAAGASA